MQELLLFVVGFMCGGGIFGGIYIWARQKFSAQNILLQTQLQLFTVKANELQQKLNLTQEQILELTRTNASAETQNHALHEKLATQQEQFTILQKQFKEQFENLAQKIFEEKSEKFKQQNQAALSQMLDPLKEKLKEFEEKSVTNHKENTEQNIMLREQLNQIKELGLRMSQETHNLTKALKGDTKKQGIWGELILEKILEASGLERGREYQLQFYAEDETGGRQIPDAVVNLPENKHIIIDAKVSLVAFEEWNSADDDAQKQRALLRHVDSVKKHISGLGEKHYISAKGINSPDFVLLFMPVEACLAVSLQADPQLFEYAWKRKIVLVTPSTLLATLKTVSSLWRYEKQNANAQKIAEMGRRLYEQFVEFVDEMEKIEKGIDSAKSAYSDAMNRLRNSSHSIINRAEKLKQFGVTPKKHLKTEYVNLQDDELKTEIECAD